MPFKGLSKLIAISVGAIAIVSSVPVREHYVEKTSQIARGIPRRLLKVDEELKKIERSAYSNGVRDSRVFPDFLKANPPIAFEYASLASERKKIFEQTGVENVYREFLGSQERETYFPVGVGSAGIILVFAGLSFSKQR